MLKKGIKVGLSQKIMPVLAKGEETRGPRSKNPEPGRTYECEVWCRDASRQLAGCVGFTVLVLTYAVRCKLRFNTFLYIKNVFEEACHL